MICTADRGAIPVLQSDPNMLPRMQIDKGGIRFIMVRSERTGAGCHCLLPTAVFSLLVLFRTEQTSCALGLLRQALTCRMQRQGM